MQVHIIGAGLAGCEAAWQLAIRRIPVTLYEMRGIKQTPAHITSDFAELVCANSFRSDDIENCSWTFTRGDEKSWFSNTRNRRPY